MPELPEVETIKRGLNKLIVGQKISTVSFDNVKSFPNTDEDVDNFMLGATIIEVKRRAKVLIISLNTNYSLVIHLKMTGQLVFVDKDFRFGAGHPNDSLIGRLPDKSTRVTFNFSDGSRLFFNDQRKFGWIRLLPTILVPEMSFFKKVGPEPLEVGFSKQDFKARFANRQRSKIKAAILDQSVIAGVGNIYADESLWGAKIHPGRLVDSLSDDDFSNLYDEIRYVMNLSIEKGGSTDRNYIDAEGKKGSYLQFARVFRREGLACPRCGTDIIKIRVAGRGTHICPNCQKI
ncbi:DNA-formamidopyrimidine glycosylase [Candidatus Saccharibacteria bacterium]|nr:DNA-formamidopyrimidine glycosylase [Candidatus Saccharibacteria bacterium]